MWTDDDERPAPLPDDRAAAIRDPHFLAWFRGRLWVTPELMGLHPDTATRNAVVSWFVEDVGAYVWFQCEDSYRGPNYAWGAWRLRADLVTRDFPQALADVRYDIARAADAHITALDDWLRADMRGALTFPGCRGGSPTLPDSLRTRVFLRASHRRAAWPRPCGVCGASYRPSRPNARRCPSCIAGSKGGKGLKGANPAIGATEPPSVPSVPRATLGEGAGTTGTNGRRGQ